MPNVLNAPPLSAGHRLFARALASAPPGWGLGRWGPIVVAVAFAAVVVWAALARSGARRGREYERLRVLPYRGDSAEAEAVVAMFEALHKRLMRRWWRRAFEGQPSISLEIHFDGHAWLAVCFPAPERAMVESALRVAYPNCRLVSAPGEVARPPSVLRLKKSDLFIKRSKAIDRFAHQREPAVNRLLTAMAAAGGAAFVQVAATPTPASFERHAKRLYKRHEAGLSRRVGGGAAGRWASYGGGHWGSYGGGRGGHHGGGAGRGYGGGSGAGAGAGSGGRSGGRSMVEDAELRGGLEVQHRPLFFTDLRVVAGDRRTCERVASELRAQGAENGLVERGTAIRHGLLGLYARRVLRGEGNPVPCTRRGVFASTELAAVWHMPSIDYAAVPFERTSLPVAPAPPGIMRPAAGPGTLSDAAGPVSIHVEMRRQNTAVTGTVEQGKSSYLAATVAEDLRRERCAVILLDPKGDAADAAVSLVPAERTVTLLDFAHPTCGFNPLAVDAPADVIADYVVGALKNLFTDADIRASSDRYLRNAIIAVLAYSRSSTLWDAARLLSVGRDGYSYRAAVGAKVRELPELKEISEFFTAELTAQLADARSATTSKLDAPVNKLARLLNSGSIKRVLLNGSLTVDFDRVIRDREVLVVKGALGGMGAGNTSVLMQLLMGMLDAALARQQDMVDEDERVAVALKVDEAPLVLNRGFAETIALKRSAGLETVACWQTDSQWTDREVRAQLDALFAHRVCFATASAEDARSSARLTMAEFSDTVRPRIDHLSALGHPDTRLHLPKHHAIVSWTTPEGRQPPFLADTLPLRVQKALLELHRRRQEERGGRYLSDLAQPHWEKHPPPRGKPSPPERATPEAPPGVGQAVAPTGPQEHAPRLGRLPEAAAESYRELVELDNAPTVRRAGAARAGAPTEPEERDLEALEMVVAFGHLLTTQIHHRIGGGRSMATTQRRLKRLADAGLLERVQFHRSDGGGAPMCCGATDAAVAALQARGRLAAGAAEKAAAEAQGRSSAAIRRDLHAAGWALAFERATGLGRLVVAGPGAAAISPPTRPTTSGPSHLGPSGLRLPGGRAPHRFVRSGASGQPEEVERFGSVRPQLRIDAAHGRRPWLGGEGEAPAQKLHELPGGDHCAGGEAQSSGRHPALWPQCDLLLELDDRAGSPPWTEKLRRWDHFLTGWCVHTRRYGRTSGGPPLVVFVCRDRARARRCGRLADHVLVACRAYAGERPSSWEYVGRERIVFVAERDVHEGLLGGYGVGRLPPEIRAAQGRGADPGGYSDCKDEHDPVLTARAIAHRER